MQCVKCGLDNGQGSNFCNSCGAKLHTEASAPSAGAIISGERRRVTAMFADVVDSTPLAERIGEEALYKVMQ
jgi:class 3 adenylate cyclase